MAFSRVESVNGFQPRVVLPRHTQICQYQELTRLQSNVDSTIAGTDTFLSSSIAGQFQKYPRGTPISGASIHNLLFGCSKKHLADMSSRPCSAHIVSCHRYKATPPTKLSLLSVILTGGDQPWAGVMGCLVHPVNTNNGKIHTVGCLIQETVFADNRSAMALGAVWSNPEKSASAFLMRPECKTNG